MFKYWVYLNIYKYKLKMGTKLIKEIDDYIWRKFAGYCKAKGEKVGKKLSEILRDYLKDKIK